MEEPQDDIKTQRGQSPSGQPLILSEQQPQEEIEYDLTAVTLSKDNMEPIPIDGEKEIMKLLHSGVLKGIENPKVRERFVQAITIDRVGKVFKLSFYFILASNFPECVKFEEEEAVINILKKKLSKNYVKLFSIMPQPKDEIVNMIIFCLGYASHYLFYQLFSKQRELFDLRFVFNCYHILIFEFNGIFVSDFYIRMNIDKLFHQNKFLDYERVNKKNLILQQQAKNKAKVKTFFGFNLPFPEIQNQEGQSFVKQVQDKFKPPKKNIHLQDDHLTDHITTQEKQIKIKNKLKEKRIKQIEECELKKMDLFQSTQQDFKSDPQRNQQEKESLSQHSNQADEAEKQKMISTTLTMKMVMEKAEEIFDRTAIKSDEGQSKEDQNYFSNLQLNCNQISPTISNVLAYDNRTLPFAKKKMIRHAFETVNDKEDNLLAQLKQFSQSRKQKKETKLTQKVNKSIIDHFGLRPPPREYYQKHPKLDKMFKDMLDLNYVLKQNQESMNQLPSSVQMQFEQANEWQQAIVDQEVNYNKTNQRQKVQENLQEVINTNQKYQLEKRAGYRKKFIYTKPLQYMKKTIPLSEDTAKMAQSSIILGKPGSRQPDPAKVGKKDDGNIQFANMMNVTMPNFGSQGGDKLKNMSGMYLPSIDQTINDERSINTSALNVNGSVIFPSTFKSGNTVSLDLFANKTLYEDRNKKNIKQFEESNPHRTFEFKVIETDSKNNKGRGFFDDDTRGKGQINNAKDNRSSQNEFYTDKRKFYKDKYKGFLNNMNTDNNIDDILQNILHQRNQFNRNLNGKIKNM